MNWIKSWVSIVDNPKVQEMDGGLFKFWINCVHIAANTIGRNGRNGALPPVTHLARRLQIRADDAEIMLDGLVKRGLVDVDLHGERTMHDWEDWQLNPNALRQQALRDRRKAASQSVTPVTPVTNSNEETETETETETEKKKRGKRVPRTRSEAGPVSPKVRTWLDDYRDVMRLSPPKDRHREFEVEHERLGSEEFIRRLKDDWRDRGFNPKNVKGILDVLRNGHGSAPEPEKFIQTPLPPKGEFFVGDFEFEPLPKVPKSGGFELPGRKGES